MTAETNQTGKWERLREAVLNHDESRKFSIAYILAAVVLSIVISLFWLVAVVAVHFALDMVKNYHDTSSLVQSTKDSAYALKLDISFIFFALAASVYLNVMFGVAGVARSARLSRLPRAGTQVSQALGEEALGFQRVIKGVMMSADDVAQCAKGAARLKSGINFNPENPLYSATGFVAEAQHNPSSDCRRSKGDIASILLGVICIGLLILAPVLTGIDYLSILEMLADELQPFPTG
ncbi:MAG: hypothetical protein HXY34_03525 [Candidatus Thorarchaeota archaeon]|nr:hypothetical protein [Candidatus Thorarchaeota archaeon]